MREARPAAAATEEKYIGGEAADLPVFWL